MVPLCKQWTQQKTHDIKYITIVIYIQYLWIIRSQYSKVWEDHMETNNGWSTSGNVEFSYTSQSCTTGLCTKTACTDATPAWIRRETDISQYSSIQLQFDVSTRSMKSNTGECRVYYSYTSSSLSNRLQIYNIVPMSGDRLFYPDQEIDLPSATSANTVWIWLEAYCIAIDSDYSYWDNVYLNGIKISTDPTTASTRDPATAPTRDQTTASTVDPTTASTGDPTTAPTRDPTTAPTVDSTTASTGYPTTAPTEDPTLSPIDSIPVLTETPTRTVTNQPQSHPTNGPILSPVETDNPKTSSSTAPTTDITTASIDVDTDTTDTKGTSQVSVEYIIAIAIGVVAVVCVMSICGGVYINDSHQRHVIEIQSRQLCSEQTSKQIVSVMNSKNVDANLAEEGVRENAFAIAFDSWDLDDNVVYAFDEEEHEVNNVEDISDDDVMDDELIEAVNKTVGGIVDNEDSDDNIMYDINQTINDA